MGSTRQSVVEAAEKYLFDGLVQHRAEGSPFAPEARRTELGRNTGDSAEAIRKSLASDVMKVITGISDLRWIVEGEEGVAFYDLHTTTQESPVRIAERFRVVDGLIVEIEAIFHMPAAASGA